MKEPKAYRQEDTRPNIQYYYWPDGTLREMKYSEYVQLSITKSRVLFERLIFILKGINYLIRNFNRIEVRKRLTRRGKTKYESSFKNNSELCIKRIDIFSGNITL